MLRAREVFADRLCCTWQGCIGSECSQVPAHQWSWDSQCATQGDQWVQGLLTKAWKFIKDEIQRRTAEQELQASGWILKLQDESFNFLIMPFLLYMLSLFLLLPTPAYRPVVHFIWTQSLIYRSCNSCLFNCQCCSCYMETTFAELLNLDFSSFGGQTPSQKLFYLTTERLWFSHFSQYF